MHLITDHQICEAKAEQKGEIESCTVNSCRFPYATLKNGQKNQKENKEIEDLNTITQLDLTDMYRTL